MTARSSARLLLLAAWAALGACVLGCQFLGGAAVGAGATGAAEEEYLARKREIERRSVLY